MRLVIDYILCYSTAFLLGAFVGGVSMGYYNTEQHRKDGIRQQRAKQLRRDAR